jgi:hypothetical protein
MGKKTIVCTCLLYWSGRIGRIRWHMLKFTHSVADDGRGDDDSVVMTTRDIRRNEDGNKVCLSPKLLTFICYKNH